VLNSLSNARWEAHAVAKSAILDSSKFGDAFQNIAEDSHKREKLYER
jgi:hypothetical protein